MQTVSYFLDKIFSESVLKKVFPNGCEWTKERFLKQLNWHNTAIFDMPHEAILSLSLPKVEAVTQAIPEVLQLLLTIFYDGKYSNDDYFTIDGDAEPATELLHGLEFATYLFHAGAPDEAILAGMLHDISRFYTMPDHANCHHHTDGYALLEALFGVEVGEFCLFHGLGKAHLYDAVSDYPDDMTNVSMKTLVLQRTGFDELQPYLDGYPSKQDQQYVVLKAMFFRLFDDASKYPLKSGFHLVTRDYVTSLMLRVFNKYHPSEVQWRPFVSQMEQGLVSEPV